MSTKNITDLGHEHHKYDSCTNDCIVYTKEFNDLQQCPICGSDC